MRVTIILMLWLLVATSIKAQELKGKVTGQPDNNPLIGASIHIVQTKQTLITNQTGNFATPIAKGNYTLEISYVGFVGQILNISVPLTKPLELTLWPQTTQLQEVAVVSNGYQLLNKERNVGSFATLSNSVLNEQVGTNILNRLEFIANGLTADRSTGASAGNLMVRGLSTMRGVKSPLIVLDNFPYEGDPNNINPNDVESVTILKDAVATSIWGAKAGNGVIVITTKKAKYHAPLKVAFNSNVTLGAKINLSGYPQMASADFIAVERMLYGRGYYNSQINAVAKMAVSPVVELLMKKTAGTITDSELETALAQLGAKDVRDDFSRYFYQHPISQQYALSLSAGQANYSWHLSAGYDHNANQLAAGYQKLNLRFDNTFRLFKNLEINAGLAYTNSQTQSGKPAYGEVSSKSGNLYPYASFADEAGNAVPIVKDYRMSYIATAGNGKLLDWKYYPLNDHEYNSNNGNLQDVILNLNANYNFFNTLRLGVQYQRQQQKTANEQLATIESYMARDLINRFTQINATTGVVSNRIPKGGILSLANANQNASNFRTQLSYDEQFGEHQLTGILGAELRDNVNESNSDRLYGYDPATLAYSSVDQATPYPTFITGGASYIIDGNGRKKLTNRFVSVFGNLNYAYKDRYAFFVSGRRDASNMFGVNTNDKWNLLWSAGTSWELSKEKFYQIDWLPYLKLRASYGISGNTDPSLTAETTIAYEGNSVFTQSVYARFRNYFNPELKWETVAMQNYSLDFRLKDNWLTGNIAYFTKKTKDLYGVYPLDYTSGVGETILKNVASTKGQGVDLELQSQNLSGKLKWSTLLNASYYNDKVLAYYNPATQGSNYVTSVAPAISGIVGKPIYGMYSYKWAGLDPATGEPRGYKDGLPNKDYAALMGTAVGINELVYSGNVLPKFYGSLSNVFGWGNWQLNVRVMFKAGYYFRKESINYTSLFSSWRGHSDFAERWQQPGDELTTNVPALIYPSNSNRDTFYAGSEALVLKGDHIRLQYINLSYVLNDVGLAGAKFRSIKFYANVSNIGLLWKANKEGIDPDYRRSISPFQTYSVGLSGSF